MARYKVIKKAFHKGELYKPEGKRNTLTLDKPFPKGKTPSWLKLMKEPTKAELDAEKKKTDVDKKTDEEKAKSDKIDKDDVTFTGNPAKVQTL